MIDLEKFQDVLAGYKKTFPTHWADKKFDEKYKWEAVKWFQDHWDIDAENFGAMFKEATRKAANLLNSGYAYPKSMIEKFAKADDEAVRAMFRNLFDESQELSARVAAFEASAEELRGKYNDGTWKSHYQNTNAISTYLWFRYPDRYYIYKSTVYRDVAKMFSVDFRTRRDGMAGGFHMYDELNALLRQDTELVTMVQEALTPECYPDPEFKTLTVDFGFYLSRYYPNEPKEGESIVEEQKNDKPEQGRDAYTKADFLREVFMDEKRYDVVVQLLKHKKNVILQGAPGVGKTFTAKRLAYSMMGCADKSRIEMVQFHQNYSYEDFVMGYRPDGNGFTLKDGIFYRFCKKAAADPEQDYFFIIDEINRGNLSKIFGELLMLIEADYRGTEMTLAYNGELFSVPKNLYLIGMMNTADRSLAMIDYALRRRFSFFEMEPGFGSEGFQTYQDSLANETFNALIRAIQELNLTIAQDASLGTGFQIGHSYFCGMTPSECTDDRLRSIVEFDILPTLAEYWFDDAAKVSEWESRMKGIFDD